MMNQYFIGNQQIKKGDYLCIQNQPYEVVEILSTGLSIKNNELYPLPKNQFMEEHQSYFGTDPIALKYLRLNDVFICNKDECPEYHL